MCVCVCIYIYIHIYISTAKNLRAKNETTYDMKYIYV